MENTSEIANNTDIDDEYNNELVPSRQIQFWTILIFEIPSLICIIYLLYHLLFDTRFRRALHNHVVIILLLLAFIVEVIDNPLYLDVYLHNGKNSFNLSSIICLIWWFIDYGIYGTITVFLAWASFERHILIFYHNRLLGTQRKRLFFHYLPLGLLFIYMIGFYIGVILFPSCENIFDFESDSCGMSPCYEEVSWMNIWDYWINGILCVLIEAVCSIYLLIRVIWHKRLAHRPIHWKKHRKMTIQLLSMTTLSLSITLPQSLITAIQEMIPGMDDFASKLASYFFYLTNFVVLCLPFVCLASLPELWPKFLFIQKRRQRSVVPFIATATRKHSIMMRPGTIFK